MSIQKNIYQPIKRVMSRVLSPKMKFNLIVKEISCSQKKKKKFIS